MVLEFHAPLRYLIAQMALSSGMMDPGSLDQAEICWSWTCRVEANGQYNEFEISKDLLGGHLGFVVCDELNFLLSSVPIADFESDLPQPPWLKATIFAPFVFRFLLNRYVASEGLGEAEEHVFHVFFLEAWSKGIFKMGLWTLIRDSTLCRGLLEPASLTRSDLDQKNYSIGMIWNDCKRSKKGDSNICLVKKILKPEEWFAKHVWNQGSLLALMRKMSGGLIWVEQGSNYANHKSCFHRWAERLCATIARF